MNQRLRQMDETYRGPPYERARLQGIVEEACGAAQGAVRRPIGMLMQDVCRFCTDHRGQWNYNGSRARQFSSTAAGECNSMVQKAS